MKKQVTLFALFICLLSLSCIGSAIQIIVAAHKEDSNLFLYLPLGKHTSRFLRKDTKNEIDESLLLFSLLERTSLRNLEDGSEIWTFKTKHIPYEVEADCKVQDIPDPDIYTVYENEQIARLNRMFVGKKVWSYGGGSYLQKFDGGIMERTYSSNTVLVIRRIYRLGHSAAEVSYGAAGSSSWDHNAWVITDTPLLVIYDLEKSNPELSKDGWFEYPDLSSKPIGPPKKIIGAFTFYADIWHLKRSLSFTDPQKLEKSWPTAMRKAWLKRGMTYEMVAWHYGWPSVIGTAKELKRMSVWEYVQPKPHEFKIFFRNGRVTHWQRDINGNIY